MVYMKLRQSMKINHKKVERIYYENSLSLKKRTFRRKQKIGRPATSPAAETGRWLAMDFVTDSVGNRRAIRILTAVDPITKEAVIVKPCFSMTGREVSEELEKAAGRNGPLLYLQTDNGPEFRSRALEEWTDDYNRNRPQKGLKGLTPEQFKSKLLSAKPNLNSGRTLG
ncbi:MAG: transposase family protein [Elusimicrobiales bacterium]|nr:transposase family protein [Elusimicrobiales bacterium]